MKKLICSSLALICIAASAVSCGAKKEKEKKDEFIGKWQCEKIVMEGEESDNVFGIEASALFQIELKDGNKGTINSLLLTDDGEPADIEWKKSGEKVQLINDDIFEDEEVLLAKEGDKVVIDMSAARDEKENKAHLVKVGA